MNPRLHNRQLIIVTEGERGPETRLTEAPSVDRPLVVQVIDPHGQVLALSPAQSGVLEQVVQVLLRGDAIAIVPVDQELTTQEAADFLNLSRQYLVQLLERDEIPFSKAGTHRRIKFGDLLAYKQRRDARRRQVLNQLTELGQEMGDYVLNG